MPRSKPRSANSMPGDVRAADVNGEAERIPAGDAGAADDRLVEDVEPGDLADLWRVTSRGRERLGDQLRPVHGRHPARGIEREREQRARAGRLEERHHTVDDQPVDPAVVAQVDHRRLGEAPDDLVGRGDDEVRACLERGLGKLVREGDVRAPRFVDDEGQVARVADLDERGNVGARAEVGRRDDQRRRPRRERRRAPPRARRASGSGRLPARGRSRGR